MEEFQASEVYLQVIFPAAYLQALLASLGVATDKIQTFSWGGEDVEKMGVASQQELVCRKDILRNGYIGCPCHS